MFGMDSSPVMLQLVEANKRLNELRKQAQMQRKANGSSGDLNCQVVDTPPWDKVSLKPLSTTDRVASLPGHLGWGSDAVTAVISKHVQHQAETANQPPALLNKPTSESPICTPPTTPKQELKSTDWVKLYPNVGLGMLREGLTAPGRLWLVLKYLDMDGRGVLRIDTARNTLTNKTSTLYLCGKRQLRNLLQDGEGVYWRRDKERIWLRSVTNVAYALGVEQLTGRPIALPVAALLDGVGTFRAHLYAAFHSGRAKGQYGVQNNRYGKGSVTSQRSVKAMPIARDTLVEISGVGKSSQRNYEARVDVAVQANFAVGDLSTKENQEKRAWQQGQSLFVLKDFCGQQGKKGKSYLAWQLPNSYIGQHGHRPRGRQKRINRTLKDLVMKGMPGNVEETIEIQKLEKVYFPNGKLAVKACGRDLDRELYWKRHGTENGRFQLWQQLGG